MNTATQALGIIFASIVIVISAPAVINLFFAIGPFWLLLVVVAVLFYFSR